MNNRERFLRTMRYEPVDRRPIYLAGPWTDTLVRWRKEGLPADTDPHVFLGVSDLGYKMTNVTPVAGLYPVFETKVLHEEDNLVFKTDSYGRTVKDFKDHTSMPEWVDFPVKTADDLRRMMDEHFDIEHLDLRFAPDWEKKNIAAQERGDLIMIDGGCYYWTLRSLAGVETASYLLYDCPELVDELFERYFTVVMEGLRRAVKYLKIDLIGYGEDFAFKTGPLLSPEMFRKLILPRYRKTMEFAHEHGVEFTWHDSDGDYRLFLDDMLGVGINGIAPCEVAANMDPAGLRRQFGKDLRMGGGFDKRIVSAGLEAVGRELERLSPLLREGGLILGIDHSVPADVSWDNYRRYIDAIVKAAKTGM
ncbi:MAG: uroporphyrinogen decarboxylase family protein [Victivallales bacterium]